MDNDDKKYIPALRFPEFQNNGKWTTKLIGDIANTFSGGTPSVGNNNYYGGNIPFIRSGEIAKKDTELYITELGLSSSSAKMVNKGTILYALYGATSGEVAISQIDGAINQAILAIIPKENLYYNKYIYYFLQYQKQNILSKYLQGGQGNLSGAIINNLVIVLPCDANNDISFDEQKRIADSLSSLDKHIDATKKKLKQLKEHKKGLMQHLFPAKGKTIPELRFPEFKDDGEWEILPLDNDIFPFVSNNTLSRAELNYNSGIVQNVHYGDVLIKYREYLNVKNEKLPFITDTQNVQKYDNAKLENGDIIIADTAEDETVGKCTEIQEIANKIIVSGLHTIAIRSKIKFAKYYLGFYMNSNSFREQIYHLMQGIKVLSISKTAIRQTKICFPKSLIEQSKIAGCLLDLDNSIISFENKIKALELHKKGLMQQLFPKL